MSTFVVGFLCGAGFVVGVIGAALAWASCKVSGPVEYDFR